MRSRRTLPTRRGRLVRRALLACVGVSIGMGAYVYLDYWLPLSRLSNVAWIIAASEEDLREASHHVIAYPLAADHHDAFIVLAAAGDADSIPRIIRALRWHSSDQDEHESFTANGFDALEKLSGRAGDRDVDSWQRWWDETGSKRE